MRSLLSLLALLMMWVPAVQAQDLSVRFNQDNQLVKPDLLMHVNWDGELTDPVLYVGPTLSDLTARPEATGDADGFQFTAGELSLGSGKHYGEVRAQEGTSQSFTFYVEGDTPPTVTVQVDESGQVTDPHPVFQISRPPGVQSVLMGLSSTPVTIEQTTNVQGDDSVSVSGATVSWLVHTANEQIRYGDPADAGSTLDLASFEAPPLVTDSTYYFIALNVYESNGAPISAVIGSVQSFVYRGRTLLGKPTLVEPADDADLRDKAITFSWDPVEGEVTGYTLRIYKAKEAEGSSIDMLHGTFEIKSTATTYTLDAASELVNGRYAWTITANDVEGGGNESVKRSFDYTVPAGKYTLYIYDDEDQPLRNTSVRITPAEEGLPTPERPITTDYTYEIEAAPGTYHLDITHPNFLDESLKLTFEPDVHSTERIYMRKPGSAFRGRVVDGSGAAIQGATIWDAPSGWIPAQFSRTDNAGRFTSAWDSRVADQNHKLQVCAFGYLPTDVFEAFLPKKEEVYNDATLIWPLGDLELTKATVTYTGQIVNQAGTPLSGIRVYGNQEGCSGMGRAFTTGPDGNFTLVLSAGAATFTTRSEKFYSDPVQITTAPSEAEAEQSVDLGPITMYERANVLSGIVRFDGRYIRSGEVIVTPPSGDPTTGEVSNGRFTVTLPPGASAYSVTAVEKVSGMDLQSEPVDVAFTDVNRTQYATLTIPEVTSIIRGLVTRVPSTEDRLAAEEEGVDPETVTGPPIEGARVSIWRQGGYWFSKTVTTDENGRYEVAIPQIEESETYTIRAVAKNHTVSPSSLTLPLGVDQEVDAIDFEMSPGAGRIAGTVKDATGKAIADARVEVTKDQAFQPLVLQTTSDKEGKFEIQVEGGTWRVRADKTLFRANEPLEIPLQQGGESLENVLTLTDITVMFEGSVGVEGVELEATSIIRTEDDDLFTARMTTAQGGRYSMKLIEGFAYQVVARKPGYLTMTFETDELYNADKLTIANAYTQAGKAAYEITADGQLVFQMTKAPATVAGTVLDASGEPLSRAVVVGVRGGVPFDSTYTQADGSYLLGLDKGSYTLVTKRPGYAGDGQEVSLAFGETRSGVGLAMRENFATVRGRVTAGGNGVEGALVRLMGASGGSSVRTSADGSYILPRVVGGAYTLSVTQRGFSERQVENVRATGGQTTTVDVDLATNQGTIQGTIRDINGQAVAEAGVTLTHETGKTFTVRATTDGRYTFGALPFGDLELRAEKVGYGRSAAQIVTLSEATPTLTVEVADLQPNNGTLTGLVHDTGTDSPLQNVRVTATGAHGAGNAVTDTEGRYTIANLVPGTYVVQPVREGFSGASVEVAVAGGEPATADLEVRRNEARIVGRVTDVGAAALPFRVKVIAGSSAHRAETTTDDSGAFTFEGMPAGTYTLATQLRRQEYGDVSTQIEVTAGASVGPVTIEVVNKKAVIAGNAGTAQATVSVYDAATGALAGQATSASDGRYSVPALPAGTYRVAPTLERFTFSPAAREVTLSAAASATADFTAADNGATLTVRARNEAGTALGGVTVSVISTDTTVSANRVTDDEGRAVFTLTGGKTYAVTASRTGYYASPVTRQVALAAGADQQTAFSLARGAAAIAGVVRTRSGDVVRDVPVVAQHEAKGFVFRATQAGNAGFALQNLPAGSYTLTATKAGFRADTLRLTLNDGQRLEGQALHVSAFTARLRGRVLFEDAGLQGLTVTASGLTQRTTTTNQNGVYLLPDVPVSQTSDTTTYRLRFEATGFPVLERIVDVPPSQIGGTINLGDLLMPNGQIRLRVTDGVAPLPNVRVALSATGGNGGSGVTDEAGQFASSNQLRRGAYRVAVSSAGYLRPSGNALQIELATDTSRVVRTVALPYRFTAPAEVKAGDDTAFQVDYPAGFDPGAAEAALYFRRSSQMIFTRVPMQRQNGAFTALLPAQYSLEDITYYTEVTAAAGALTYRSAERTVTPSAAGVLTAVKMTPSLNGKTLRQGDTYRVKLTLRDGTDKTLQEDFVGDQARGHVTWTTSAPGIRVTLPDETDPTVATVTVDEAGTFTLEVTAQLGGALIRSKQTAAAVDAPISKMQVTSSMVQASNRSAGIQFGYSAVTEAGQSVLLGDKLAWQVRPQVAGTVTAAGVYVPVDSSYIGQVTVTAHDTETGLKASSALSVFAEVDGRAARTLTNHQGLTLALPRGAFPFPAKVGLRPGRITPLKKRARPVGSDAPYTVGDALYRLTFQTDRSLPGDSLQASATLSLPAAASLTLFEGESAIGRYDPATVAWYLLPLASNDGTSLSTQAMRRLGEYAVLVRNEPLGLKHTAVLPSPFSPDVAPVKIGYFLNTTDAPALVTIRIYNLRGELVRTLIDGEPQQPGRYGSASSLREITWDGTTDTGTLVRNGRYIIQIRAKDSTGETQQLLPVVVVK